MARRIVELDVSAPFHSQLMLPCAELIGDLLQSIQISEPKVTVLSNVTAQPVSDPAELIPLLKQQTTSTVRWKDMVLFAKESRGINTW
eukprot:CAMPEP_0201504740 /NCGR_PEP_ID=MMETSP0151_2-20130828/85380_1 /ASSEMBLY_ACC=CAM_ASM_000257 /TAXON_ID=200890 /ORGANISM="Paramoeba atlantica, Strain 621/1 / CCAP 1560/9" /LENGTH=87 /DNA_ID=CAMNT_0047898525 /DNA_START=740 /DNA_END=1000 /DNA_ORIENTATION=+